MSEPSVSPVKATAPATLRSGMDGHDLKFVPRKTLEDYRDRLYHGKPELNYKGIPYRKPRHVEKANAGDRMRVTGRQPVSDRDLVEMAGEFQARTGRAPVRCIYPGDGNKWTRGLGGIGILLDLEPGGPGVAEAYLE